MFNMNTRYELEFPICRLISVARYEKLLSDTVLIFDS